MDVDAATATSGAAAAPADAEPSQPPAPEPAPEEAALAGAGKEEHDVDTDAHMSLVSDPTEFWLETPAEDDPVEPGQAAAAAASSSGGAAAASAAAPPADSSSPAVAAAAAGKDGPRAGESGSPAAAEHAPAAAAEEQPAPAAAGTAAAATAEGADGKEEGQRAEEKEEEAEEGVPQFVWVGGTLLAVNPSVGRLRVLLDTNEVVEVLTKQQPCYWEPVTSPDWCAQGSDPLHSLVCFARLQRTRMESVRVDRHTPPRGLGRLTPQPTPARLRRLRRVKPPREQKPLSAHTERQTHSVRKAVIRVFERSHPELLGLEGIVEGARKVLGYPCDLGFLTATLARMIAVRAPEAPPLPPALPGRGWAPDGRPRRERTSHAARGRPAGRGGGEGREEQRGGVRAPPRARRLRRRRSRRAPLGRGGGARGRRGRPRRQDGAWPRRRPWQRPLCCARSAACLRVGTHS